MQNVENLLREYIINAILSHLLEQPAAAASYANFNWFSATLIGVRVLGLICCMYVSSSEMRRLLDKYVRARGGRECSIFTVLPAWIIVSCVILFLYIAGVEERWAGWEPHCAKIISCSSWLRMLTIIVWRCQVACRRICITKILKGPKIMRVTPALAWERGIQLFCREN